MIPQGVQQQVQVCPRCQRANPSEAAHCYFDGAVLRQGPGGAPAGTGQQLPREYVFPSGRRCRTFDALVEGCRYEWEDARFLLRKGDFVRFFTQIGRNDLARTARKTAEQEADDDVALHHFLDALPAVGAQGPRLELEPRRLMIGPLRPGENRLAQITIANQGQGLLQGKVTVTEGSEWLKVVNGQNDHTAILKTGRDQRVNLRVECGSGMAPQSYAAKLTVITNGGIAEVPVRLDLTATPFPHPPLDGATSPRALAERMRVNPKPSVPLLESGEIARWFNANGWAYPVSGVPARGVAAVQQFFECMGLSKPPSVELSTTKLHYTCSHPQTIQGEVHLRTQSRKWVFAQTDSEVPWVRVLTPNVSGPQQVSISFEVDSSLLEVGQTHETTLQVVANAGQRLPLQLRVEVRRSQASVGKRLFRPIFVGALLALLLRLFLVFPADLFARLLACPGGWPQPDQIPPPGTLAGWAWGPTMMTSDHIGHFLLLMVLTLWWLGAPLGLILVWKKGALLDKLFGIIAGAGFGLFASATIGCMLLVFDTVPRTIMWLLQSVGLEKVTTSALLWTPFWIFLVVCWWAVLGGIVGLLLWLLGKAGATIITTLASPFAWGCRLLGMEQGARFFVMDR